MTKYEVKAVVCDYGIFENGKLKLIVNSQANALMIKYVLEKDLNHKVVIKDLLESKTKPKRKFRAMTKGEFCRMWKAEHVLCKGPYLEYCCPLYFSSCNFPPSKPYKTEDGKYILREVKQ